jgi:hypothetical protein
MGDPSDATEGTKGLPVAPPTPLAAGWYADPQSLDAAGLRYWDGSDWTDKTAATSAQDAPRKPRGVRRSLVLWIASIAVVIAVAASGLGVWKVTVAKGLQDKTTVIDKQTATLQEETDELNAS